MEAIALGHDLGHTPFGHAGERALNRVCPFGFEHAEQSVRTVDILEKDGKGLNLTYEVRDGIRNHQTIGKPHTLEARSSDFPIKLPIFITIWMTPSAEESSRKRMCRRTSVR